MAGSGVLSVLSLLLFAATVSSSGRFVRVDLTKSWTDAKDYCASAYGTTLATITSDAEAATVLDMLSGVDGWIGLNDENVEGKWVWASGYECDSDCADLKWWINGEPTGGAQVMGSEDCGIVGKIGTTIENMLNDIPCASQQITAFLCDGWDVTVDRFIAVDATKSWSDANAYCASEYGTTLATITSDAEAATVMNMLGGSHAWIGLNDRDVEGKWVWASGHECGSDCADLEWWYPNEPNDYRSAEDCAHKRSGVSTKSELLNDRACEQQLKFICDGIGFVPSMCSPTMTGFYWSGFNGEWVPMSGVTAGGETVYTKTAYGWSWYLWLETDYSSPAWVIGQDYTVNWMWGWKYGDDLFDDATWWYRDNSYVWNVHSVNPDISCSDSSDAAAIAVSDDTSDGPATDGTVADMDTIPPSTSSASDSLSLSLIIGVSIGAVVLVAAVIVVLVKRSKQTTKPAASTHGAAHHVAELSPTDIAVAVADVIPAETQSAEAVEVVEEAAPKESEAVIAEM